MPFAREIHLSLIRSPEYSPSSQFDQTLLNYLKMPKILKKNDVIAINTTGKMLYIKHITFLMDSFLLFSDNIEFLGETNLKDAR